MSADLELREHARSSDADVRQKAAVQLSRNLSDDDLALAFEMLGDRDWRVRKTIVEGLLRRTDASIIAGLIDALRDPENAGKRNSATEALVRIGDDSIEHIIETLLNEEDLDVRLSLVNLLGDVRNERGFSTLLEQLPRENDINILSATVASIGKYRNAQSIPALLRALQRDDLWLKFHVIEALGEIGDRSALPAILPLYAEKSLRKPVLEAIGKIADVGTVNFLLRIVADEDKLNRKSSMPRSACSFSASSANHFRPTSSTRSSNICAPRRSATSVNSF
jgi:HEAT repeat protein